MLVTTSRKPCARTRVLAHDLARLVPETATLNRGKQSIDAVAEAAREAGHARVTLIMERHGNPSAIRFIAIDESGWDWAPIQIVFQSVKLSREFDTRARSAETLSIEDSTGLGLSDLLGVDSDEDSETRLVADKRAITFFQAGKEIGPRMTIKAVLHEAAAED